MKQVKLLFSIIFSFITVVCFGQLMPLADEAVTLNTQNGAIHGKILLPPGMKSSPVVLLIAGSGPTDMDGNSAIGQMTNNSLKYLAEDLAEQVHEIGNQKMNADDQFNQSLKVRSL